MTAIGRAFSAPALSASLTGNRTNQRGITVPAALTIAHGPAVTRPRSAACTLVTELAEPMTSALGAG